MSGFLLALIRSGAIFAAVLVLSMKSTKAAGYLCENKGQTYWIKIEYEIPNSDLPCSVFRWVLPKEPELLWRATNVQGFCEAKADEIKQRLVTYGWQCVGLSLSGDRPERRPIQQGRPAEGASTPTM